MEKKIRLFLFEAITRPSIWHIYVLCAAIAVEDVEQNVKPLLTITKEI